MAGVRQALKRHLTLVNSEIWDQKRGVLRRSTRADRRTNAPWSFGPAGDLAVGRAPARPSPAAERLSLGANSQHSGRAFSRPTWFSAFSRTSCTCAVGG